MCGRVADLIGQVASPLPPAHHQRSGVRGQSVITSGGGADLWFREEHVLSRKQEHKGCPGDEEINLESANEVPTSGESAISLA